MIFVLPIKTSRAISIVDVELISNIQKLSLSPSSGVDVGNIVLACCMYTKVTSIPTLAAWGRVEGEKERA
jgi:hypothetical protein